MRMWMLIIQQQFLFPAVFQRFKRKKAKRRKKIKSVHRNMLFLHLPFSNSPFASEIYSVSCINKSVTFPFREVEDSSWGHLRNFTIHLLRLIETFISYSVFLRMDFFQADLSIIKQDSPQVSNMSQQEVLVLIITLIFYILSQEVSKQEQVQLQPLNAQRKWRSNNKRSFVVSQDGKQKRLIVVMGACTKQLRNHCH